MGKNANIKKIITQKLFGVGKPNLKYDHILTHILYTKIIFKIKEVNWENLPKSVDLAWNDQIRT